MASAPGTAACAACRVLRRKCTAQCLFAPYFPPDQPQKFAHVHKVFGVANVTKMLHELPPPHREDCVNSLAYEADARVQDPVYGCVGAISVLQQQVAHLQAQLSLATSEIARLRETFAIAAAASNHNNSVVSNNNNSTNNATSTNNNGPLTASGGALFMAALQPSLRSSPPHCSHHNTQSNATLINSSDQEPCQDLLNRPSDNPSFNSNLINFEIEVTKGTSSYKESVGMRIRPDGKLTESNPVRPCEFEHHFSEKFPLLLPVNTKSEANILPRNRSDNSLSRSHLPVYSLFLFVVNTAYSSTTVASLTSITAS
ncbi:hypothetical protein R1sor_011158 [Riccia sorocarpa]|uniref:LOB domain-containing protein n=1 Tax=Riccia sorocarpa TaxID=122646 RepID=A0ABD3I034_9MARC